MRRVSTLPLWIELPARAVARLLFRVRALGAFHVPAGGAVVIANHLSYIDAVVLQLACPRPLRFVAYEGPGSGAFLRWVFLRSRSIRVPPQPGIRWLRTSVDALRRGELVCVFPEGGISRTGQLMPIRRGFEVMARRARVPVVPAAIDGVWGSVFSFSGGCYLWKRPRLSATPVCVAFGPPLAPERADPASARRALLDLGAEAFSERPFLKGHLGREVVRALASRPRSVALVDRTSARRPLSAAQLLAATAVLSRRLRETVPEARVGIVLPPGAGAAIANLAVLCAGKVPVNLNFTAGRGACESSLAASGVRTVISAEALRARLPDFPWPERTVDVRAELEAAGGRRAMAPWVVAAWLLPGGWFADRLRVPDSGGDSEAGLMFTSGSAGSPKGVVLSHRNLLANCSQIASMAILHRRSVMLGCLPVFHSFGFTATMWYPLWRGCRLVTSPSPLDSRALVDAIREESISVLLGAPTFLRPLLKRAQPSDLRSLELVVAGAEKLPMDVYGGYLKAFHLEILQGYGLTESSPVSCLNQPAPPVTTETAEPQQANRPGTVGRLIPGMTARFLDPESGAERRDGDTGILALRGPNIFSHYLGDEPGSALRDGWFVTGDLARVDADGFLTVEGRVSRFSKLAGEMVPHGTIEQAIAEAFGADPSEGQAIVVVGVGDAAKGEALAVVTTLEFPCSEMRGRLSAAGLPNLWIPRAVHRVAAIPMLGTGKVDLAACRRVAQEDHR